MPRTCIRAVARWRRSGCSRASHLSRGKRMFQIAPHRRSHRRERRKRAGAARKSDKEWAGRGRPATGLKYLMYQLEWVFGGQREFRPRPTSSAQRAPGWSADEQQTPFGPRRCGVYHGLAPSARVGEGQLMQRLERCRMRWRQGKPPCRLEMHQRIRCSRPARYCVLADQSGCGS